MDDVLILLSSAMGKNDYGVIEKTYKKHQVFCQVTSISRSEFFEAGRNGLNPEFRFTIFSGDYCGETACEYHGKTYSIYRTYAVPSEDTIELYVERRGGTNGIEVDQRV